LAFAAKPVLPLERLFRFGCPLYFPDETGLWHADLKMWQWVKMTHRQFWCAVLTGSFSSPQRLAN